MSVTDSLHHSKNHTNDANKGFKRRVAYFYDAEIGNYHYGQGHPMKVRLNVMFLQE
jgi:hypothetical protein